MKNPKYIYPKGPASDMSPDSIVAVITDETGLEDAYVGELAYGDVYCLKRESTPESSKDDMPLEALDLIADLQIDVYHTNSGIVCIETDDLSIELEGVDGRVSGYAVASAIVRHFGGVE